MNEPVLQNYINGVWISSDCENFREVTNPATDELLAKVPVSTLSELDDAVQIAHKAFQTWRRVPVTTRIQYFFKLKDITWKQILKILPAVSRLNMEKHWMNHAAKCAGRLRTLK